MRRARWLVLAAVLTVAGGWPARSPAGPTTESTFEHLADVGSGISLGLGVAPLRWELAPSPLAAPTELESRGAAMSFDVKLRWPGAETSFVQPYVEFGPTLFVVEPDYVSRMLGTRVDPTLRLGAKAGAGLNFRLGKDAAFFGAYELSTAGRGTLAPLGAKSGADPDLGGFDFTYGLRLRY
jgi:hypothetical protein